MKRYAHVLVMSCLLITNVCADDYLGELRLFGLSLCPNGWLQANGQLLSIEPQNKALFSLYGITYGGDGVTTFALPNLAGAAPYGQMSGTTGQPFGTSYGASTTTITIDQLPAHTHQLTASSNGEAVNSPLNALLPTEGMGSRNYTNSTAPADVPMAMSAISQTGQNQPLSIQSPALALNWCVSVHGTIPIIP